MTCNNFTFNHYRDIINNLLINGYKIVTCKDYFINYKKYENEKIFINRIDVDLSCKHAKKISDIFNEFDVKGSFFIRLHAPEYNLYSFENYKCIKNIISNGHEIGLHSEIVDCAKIWNESSEDIIRKEIDIINNIFNIKICGVASHGGLTGFNNLDFWSIYKPSKFDLLYEAYDPILFDNYYVSLLLLTGWKHYYKSKLIQNEKRCLCEIINQNHRVIYGLMHPIKLYEAHIYEND